MARYGVLNNLGDWANVVVNIAIMIWRYVTQTDSTRLRMMALTTLDEYVSASQLTEYDDILLALNICNLLLLTARALKYFQITNGGRRLMQSVYAAMPEITSFLPIYLSAIVGYSFIGHLLYGLKFSEWSSLSRASFRVFELNFGLYDPGPIYDAGGYMSVLFIYSANIVFCILMLNVFMAIVMSTWDKLVEREAEKATERSEFSHPMRPKDLLYLLWSDEDTLDTLIELMQQSQESDISRALLEHEWKHTGLSESPKVWETILAWYWRDHEESRPTTATADPLARTDRTLVLKSPRPHTPMALWKRTAKVAADG